ncbi:HupE/UreJ family protein [soil metagenome]
MSAPRFARASKLRAWALAVQLAVALVIGSFSGFAAAHKSSDSYLQIKGGEGAATSVRWDIALRDLDAALDLDANADGKLSWGEIKSSWTRIDAYALPRLSIDGCPLTLGRHSLESRNDGAYAVFWLDSTCALAAAPGIGYRLFAEVDPTHRGIARIDRSGSELQLRVLDPQAAAPAGGAASESSATRAEPAGHASFLIEGIHHIVGGYDHVLFLLCLLLPAVLKRTPQGWPPVDRIGQAVWPVVGIVSAFTVAHSITLGLAALKIVSLPSALIEPAIAVTIVVAAIDNVKHLFRGHRAIVTFFFGLIHGFGFAGVLGELGLPTADFALALLQFNVGLELGQLAIVIVAVGLLYAVRKWPGYQRWIIGGGSLVTGLIGLVWFIERVSGMKWLPV